MSKVIELDVRDDIRNGREPFSRIMNAVSSLDPDDQLLLFAPFEPVPLFRVMEEQGFCHTAKPVGEGVWEVLFVRQHTVPLNQPAAGSACGCTDKSADVVEVDARGLEPPQPMVRILEALETLPPSAKLSARTDRRPVHLYGQLEARGFAGQTNELTDGSFVTEIRRVETQ